MKINVSTLKNTLVHSTWIAWKDLLDLSRNRIALVMIVLMPLFMMLMTGFIFPSSNTLSASPIAIANMDNGVASEQFLKQLTAINEQGKFMVMHNATDFDDIKMQIQNGKVYAGIIIPSTFTEDILNGRQGNITVVMDQSIPQISMIMQEVLNGVIKEMNTLLAQQKVMQLNTTINQTEALAIITPYNVKFGGIVPGNPNYFEFIAPGIMAMTVMMSVMTGLPHAISHEKEFGTLDGMLVAPINRLSIIIGKTLAQTARGMLQGLIILALAILLFGVRINGSFLLVLALLLLGVFSFVGLGILITSYAKDEETASMIMMTLTFPMMFLSGVFFPIQQMPDFMQSISKLLPLTYAASALRNVMVLGASVPVIIDDLLILLVFGIVTIAIAVPIFQRAMTR